MNDADIDVEENDHLPSWTGRPLARLLAPVSESVARLRYWPRRLSWPSAAPLPRPASSAGRRRAAPLRAFAGIAPVAYLVERIGGPHVSVEVLVQAGKDPHIFEPTPRQVIALSQARLFFRVGMPFEDRLVERIAAGPAHLTVVNTAAGIARRASNHGCCAAHPHPGPLPGGEGDQCGADAPHPGPLRAPTAGWSGEGDHDDEDAPHPDPLRAPTAGWSGEGEDLADPHVWLSPPLLKTMAANVAAALSAADPRHEPAYSANLKTLEDDLDALHRRIRQSLAPYRGQAFYVFHPAFGYFADTYELRQESVEVEGKLPTPRQVFALINMARSDGVKIIFLQPQFNQQIAASIAEAIGGAVVPMDDLAFDVVANLGDVARKIAAAHRESTKSLSDWNAPAGLVPAERWIGHYNAASGTRAFSAAGRPARRAGRPAAENAKYAGRGPVVVNPSLRWGKPSGGVQVNGH